VRVDPYLYFNGRCEEALEFYRGAVGAEVVMLTRFADILRPAAAPKGPRVRRRCRRRAASGRRASRASRRSIGRARASPPSLVLRRPATRKPR